MILQLLYLLWLVNEGLINHWFPLKKALQNPDFWQGPPGYKPGTPGLTRHELHLIHGSSEILCKNACAFFFIHQKKSPTKSKRRIVTCRGEDPTEKTSWAYNICLFIYLNFWKAPMYRILMAPYRSRNLQPKNRRAELINLAEHVGCPSWNGPKTPHCSHNDPWHQGIMPCGVGSKSGKKNIEIGKLEIC